MTLAVYSAVRDLGRITLDGGKLTATDPALQSVADVAVKQAGGDPAKAYQALAGFTNGYLTIITDPAEQDAGTGAEAAWDPLRHLRKHKGEHGGGEFTKMPGGGHGHGGPPEAPPEAPPEVPSGPGHVEVLDDPMARGQLADPKTRAAAAAEVYHGIGIQETFIPHQARQLRVRLGDPEGTSDKTLGVTMLAPRHDLRTGRLTVDQLLEQGEAEQQHGGAEGTTIRLGPWITDAVAGDKAGQEQREAQTPVQWRLQDGRYKRDKTARPGDQGTVTAPWWVPSDPQHNLTDTTVAHESGHAFAESVPGTDMDTMAVWGPVADAVGVKRPDVFGRTEGGGQRVSPQKWLADHRAEIAGAVSMYGARSYGELKAELWSEYTTNATPRAPARIFGDFVRDYHAAHPDIQAAAWSYEEDPE